MTSLEFPNDNSEDKFADADDHHCPCTKARDLSAWRVTVPRLEARSFDGRSCFTFIIQVQRIDVASRSEGEDLEWIVERQYHEFYSLQSALVQYHGMFEDAKLPPRYCDTRIGQHNDKR